MAIPKEFKKKNVKDIFTPPPDTRQSVKPEKEEPLFTDADKKAREKRTQELFNKGISLKSARGQAGEEIRSNVIPARLKEREQQERQALTQGTGILTPEMLAEAKRLADENVRNEFLGLPSNINYQQALIAGTADAAVGASAGAAGGAIIGSTAGGVGAIPGALIGGVATGVGGFIKGAYSDIKSQQSGFVKAEVQNVDKSITSLNNVISAVNNGADPAEAQLLYNGIVSDTYQSYYQLQNQVRGSGKGFDDATKQLEKFEIFFRDDGVLDTINLKFNQAIVNPVAGKVEATTMEGYYRENAE